MTHKLQFFFSWLNKVYVWVIHVSQLSMHPLRTITLDNRENTVCFSKNV